MIACQPDLVRRLLNPTTSEQETAELEDHLTTCEHCQRQLNQAAGGESMMRYASRMLSSSMEVPQWSSQDRSRSVDFSFATNDAESTSREKTGNSHAAQAIDLSILAASEDPAFLGRIGNYEVQGILGRGGMGVVFRGLDRALNRNVAIKVLDPSLSSVGAARQRFAMEARAMAAISHEHVVPVYTVDTHRELPYLAMEYVPGGTLEARIRTQGPLELISILQISRQIALALAAAHECGLVHRDIKPANVLMDRGVDRVRVADFGLARVSSDASVTRSGFIAGTPQFMSPEQVRGEVCNEMSDLFSLGCVMYAMCTGHSPFRCDSVYGAMQRVVHDQPRSLRQQNPNVPEWLEQFIFKLLAKQAAHRFDSATSVATEIEHEIAYLNSPETIVRPARRWMQAVWRNPRRVAQATLIVASIAFAAFVVAGTLWIQQFRPVESMTPRESVILWHQDGTEEARALAKSISDSLYRDEPIPIAEPWHRDIMTLRQNMQTFESQFP
jgi:serine/threonine-protein kinase